MNLKLFAFIFFMCMANMSCKKKENKPKIDVSAITETDAFGNDVGTIDNTDWTKDVNWAGEELNLFQPPTAVQNANSEKADVITIFEFPNPLTSTVMFYANTSKVTFAELVITDNMLYVIDRFLFATKACVNAFQLQLEQAKYSNNTNYRLYYAFYTQADGIYFKGHGDLRITR
ncbi:MAG: hypothetical protein ABIN93_03735 [Ginsengibacter sp.]